LVAGVSSFVNVLAPREGINYRLVRVNYQPYGVSRQHSGGISGLFGENWQPADVKNILLKMLSQPSGVKKQLPRQK
jgi:hypothetical protein